MRNNLPSLRRYTNTAIYALASTSRTCSASKTSAGPMRRGGKPLAGPKREIQASSLVLLVQVHSTEFRGEMSAPLILSLGPVAALVIQNGRAGCDCRIQLLSQQRPPSSSSPPRMLFKSEQLGAKRT